MCEKCMNTRINRASVPWVTGIEFPYICILYLKLNLRTNVNVYKANGLTTLSNESLVRDYTNSGVTSEMT